MPEANGGNGERVPVKKRVTHLDSGKIDLKFSGDIELNALGTTIAILGIIVLGWMMVTGIFILGRG